MQYPKSAKSIEEQIALLKARGMQISSGDELYFAHLNYYRLHAYWLHLETDITMPSGAKQFCKGAKFSQMIDYYNFDRELRLLVLDVVEYIEISARAQWAYHLANHYDPYAYLSAAVFNCANEHQECINKLKEINSPLPIWAAVETMSFGILSKWYENTNPALRQTIANTYYMNDKVFFRFLHSLTNIRNHCAHHNRLWNRRLAIKPIIPKANKKSKGQLETRLLNLPYNKNMPLKIYNMLLLSMYLLDIISPGNDCKKRLLDLLHKYGGEHAKPMGFPDKWQDTEFWQAS